IPTLIAYFLERYGKSGISKKITSNALTKLQNYSWPGNIRELENVIHSLSILTPGDVIEEKHLPSWSLNGIGNGTKSNGVPAMSEITTSTTFKDYVNRAERAYIEHILTLCKGDKTKAASQMNIGRTTLYAKLKELGLETELKTN
ncbi:MAG: hypothetical protein HYY43_03655, partial [Deltaproteobacteria bacterium]|nr:hypothetical protein [Deltaproteobacteria bacterium]